jgi:hypothetical protein
LLGGKDMLSVIFTIVKKVAPPIITFLIVDVVALAQGVNNTISFVVAAACAFGTFYVTIRL